MPPIVPTMIVQDWGRSGIQTAPSDAKRAIGWSGGEKPAAEYMNWLFANMAEQLRYVSYDRVIDEHFVRPASGYTGGNALDSLKPHWQVMPNGQSTGVFFQQQGGFGQLGIAGGPRGPGGMVNFIQTRGQTSARLYTGNGGNFDNHDFLLQMDVQVSDRGSSGSRLEWGLLSQTPQGPSGPRLMDTGSEGNAGAIYFTSSGPSGNIMFVREWAYGNVVPLVGFTGFTGSTAYTTSLFLKNIVNASSLSPTGTHNFAVERIGQTMYVDINGKRELILSAPEPQSWHKAGFSIFPGGPAATQDPALWVDRILLGYRR